MGLVNLPYIFINIYTVYLPVLIYHKRSTKYIIVVIAVIVINANSFINVKMYAVLLRTMCIFTYVQYSICAICTCITAYGGLKIWDPLPRKWSPFQLEMVDSRRSMNCLHIQNKPSNDLMSSYVLEESLYLTRQQRSIKLFWGFQWLLLDFLKVLLKFTTCFFAGHQMFGVTTAMSATSPTTPKVWMERGDVRPTIYLDTTYKPTGRSW